VFTANTYYYNGCVVQVHCDFLREGPNRSAINRFAQTSKNTDVVIINEKDSVGRKRKI
jgi:hypothetical protein